MASAHCLITRILWLTNHKRGKVQHLHVPMMKIVTYLKAIRPLIADGVLPQIAAMLSLHLGVQAVQNCNVNDPVATQSFATTVSKSGILIWLVTRQECDVPLTSSQFQDLRAAIQMAQMTWSHVLDVALLLSKWTMAHVITWLVQFVVQSFVGYAWKKFQICIT